MSGNPVGINAGGKLEDTTFYKTLGAEIRKIDTLIKTSLPIPQDYTAIISRSCCRAYPLFQCTAILIAPSMDATHSDCDDFNLVQ